MSKRKRSKISAYTRNRNRIMQTIRRYSKKTGKNYAPLENLPTEKQLREQGITGHKLSTLAKNLGKLKPKEIIEIYVKDLNNIDPLTNQAFPNEEKFVPPVLPSMDVSMVDRRIISVFEDFIKKLPNDEGTILLRGWKNRIIEQFGNHAFAEMFKEADQIRPILSEVQIYKWNNAHDYISFAMNYLPETGPITADEYEQAIGDFRAKIEEYWDASDEWIPVL